MDFSLICFCLHSHFIDSIHWGIVGVITGVLILFCLLSFILKPLLRLSNNLLIKGLGLTIKIRYFNILIVCFFFPYLINLVDGKINKISLQIMDAFYASVLLLIDIIVFSVILKRIIGVINIEKGLKDSFNHKYQTINLIAAGFYLFYIIIHFNITDESFLPFGLCAALLGLIFSDSIKGMVAYYHLHSNNLLHIGDWIEVPSHNINGEIKDISLVTVSVKNWDNSVSNISLVTLQNSSFKNYQDLVDNKTIGRRINRSFIIDTRSIRIMTEEEISLLEKELSTQSKKQISFEQFKKGGEITHNIYLFRMYIQSWLMDNTDITQRSCPPIVRLLEPKPEGVPLQIYAFVGKKTDLSSFEQVQSEITEFVLYSMEKFDIKIYQQTSIDNISINLDK